MLKKVYLDITLEKRKTANFCWLLTRFTVSNAFQKSTKMLGTVFRHHFFSDNFFQGSVLYYQRQSSFVKQQTKK